MYFPSLCAGGSNDSSFSLTCIAPGPNPIPSICPPNTLSLCVAKMMHMTLYWGKDVTLLFDSWKTDSWTSYALTLVACVLFSVFYQYMEDFRFRFKAIPTSDSPQPSIHSPLLSKLAPTRLARLNRLISAVLFGFNSAIGYLLMLAIMSFNGGVFVAIISGLAVGYYLFRNEDGDAAVIVENSCACS